MTRIPVTIPNAFHEQFYASTHARFRKDIADHEMTVLHDDGLYRHLRFKRPGTGLYWFEIITWPGSLTIRGDMGDYLFTRLPDMFEFFGTGDINPGYWAEKTPGYGTGYRIKTYRPELFESTALSMAGDFARDHTVLDTAAFHQAVHDDVLEEKDDHHTAVRAAYDFSWNGREVFPDIAGHDFTDYTEQFLWCCLALPYAVRHYRAKDTR